MPGPARRRKGGQACRTNWRGRSGSLADSQSHTPCGVGEIGHRGGRRASVSQGAERSSPHAECSQLAENGAPIRRSAPSSMSDDIHARSCAAPQRYRSRTGHLADAGLVARPHGSSSLTAPAAESTSTPIRNARSGSLWNSMRPPNRPSSTAGSSAASNAKVVAGDEPSAARQFAEGYVHRHLGDIDGEVEPRRCADHLLLLEAEADEVRVEDRPGRVGHECREAAGAAVHGGRGRGWCDRPDVG